MCQTRQPQLFVQTFNGVHGFSVRRVVAITTSRHSAGPMIRLMGPKHPEIKCRSVAVLQVIHAIKALAQKPRAKMAYSSKVPKFRLFILSNRIKPRGISGNGMIRGAGQQGNLTMGMMGPYGFKGTHSLDKIAKGTMFNHQNALGHNALGLTLNARPWGHPWGMFPWCEASGASASLALWA